MVNSGLAAWEQSDNLETVPPQIAPIPFAPETATIDTARQIVFARLRADSDYCHVDKSGDGFSRFVEYVGWPGPPSTGRCQLTVLAIEVFWQLVSEGVLSPGSNYSNPDYPFFHLTQFGQKVLQSAEPQPYDPSGYLDQLRAKLASPDATVVAYLSESLETFRKANLVASTVMLGVAAERVFLLLCESLAAALASGPEQKEFERLLDSFALKPKLDWVDAKIESVQKRRLPGFPENAPIMLTAIFNLMRCQRNELGHPRETPPRVKREDAFANLQLFMPYYVTAEELRAFLVTTQV